MRIASRLLLGLLTGLLLVAAWPALTADAYPTAPAPVQAEAPQEAPPADPAAGPQSATLQEVGQTARNVGLRMLGAVLVLVLIFFLIKGVAYVLETLAERNAERRLLYKRLVPIARVLLWGVGFYAVLRGIFDVDAQGLFAAAAAIGVAVGFAAQDLLKNIFGGLVVLFDQSFQVGDKIEIGGTYGEVTSIGLRSTRIVTPDDNLVTVPNAQVADDQVSNANAGELDCQVATDLYLPGDVDEGRAREIAYQAAVSSPYVYLEKPIVVLVRDEYDEGHLVHLTVKAYVIDTRYEALLASDVTERARRTYREEGLLPPDARWGAGSSAGTPAPSPSVPDPESGPRPPFSSA